MRMWISGQDVDFLISADANIESDIYFQYLRMRMQMWMLKTMWISADVDVDIQSGC